MTQIDMRYIQRFSNYQKALALLSLACKQSPKSLLEQDGLIQRFEYTFELAWKTLQDIIIYKWYDGITWPRPVLEQSFSDGLIEDGRLWMSMLRDRNETSHIYDEAVIERILVDIPGRYFVALCTLESNIIRYISTSWHQIPDISSEI